jgi:hypothetical protein
MRHALLFLSHFNLFFSYLLGWFMQWLTTLCSTWKRQGNLFLSFFICLSFGLLCVLFRRWEFWVLVFYVTNRPFMDCFVCFRIYHFHSKNHIWSNIWRTYALLDSYSLSLILYYISLFCIIIICCDFSGWSWELLQSILLVETSRLMFTQKLPQGSYHGAFVCMRALYIHDCEQVSTCFILWQEIING